MGKILRIIGAIVALIVILLIVLVGYIFMTSNSKINTVYDVEPISIEVPDDEETLAEGERLFVSRGCADCHAEDGGGIAVWLDDPALGTFGSANLTSGEGGIGQTYTLEDYTRAIQHGVGADGKPLFIMPSQDWQKMPEAEITALMAYILSLEPVDREMPEPSYGPVGRTLVAFGMIPFAAETIDHDSAGLLDVEIAATVEYGAYIGFACQSCHADNYGGGTIPGSSTIATNISSHEDGIGSWSLDDFIKAMRTGVRPDDSVISTEMPWLAFMHMNDTELEAIYLFLQSTDPVEDN